MWMRRRKKKGHFLHMGGRDDQIATDTKLLNIEYKLYRFSGGVIKTIN